MATPPRPPPSQGFLDLQEMWKSLLASEWQTLAVVPTGTGVGLQRVVDAFASVSGTAGPPVRLIDARGVDVQRGRKLADDALLAAKGGARVITVIDPLTSSLSGTHLVHGATSILLVVSVGAMDLEALTSTVSMVGAERIVGSVAAPGDG